MLLGFIIWLLKFILVIGSFIGVEASAELRHASIAQSVEHLPCK